MRSGSDALATPAAGFGAPSLEEQDVELARLGRCEAQVRLRIGELLDALFERGGHHALGFSSVEAYVVERCQRNRRWAKDTRGLVRRIRERGLQAIRRAIRSGRLSWSMAELLVRHATPENEEALIDEASKKTVREMQAELTGRSVEQPEAPIAVTALRRVSAEELLMVNASRMLVEYLSGCRASDEMLMSALLGEAETSLQSLEGFRVDEVALPALDPAKIEAAMEAMREARTRRAREGENAPPIVPVLVEVGEERPVPESPIEIDREVVRCSRELALRNLRIGRLAHRLLAWRGWRALGYASAEQYARERVGLSLSSLEHRVTLARRVARYPALGEALERGAIGYEAALLIGRVLGASSSDALVEAWIARAEVRTYKYLREEVDAVLLAASMALGVSREPPGAHDLEAVADLERRVQSGEIFRSLLGARSDGPQTSVSLAAEGSSLRPLRLTLPVELHLHWRKVESQFRAVASERASFLAFACFNLWSTWLPFLEAWADPWIHVYRRDRHRCSSPVCQRRDVTPHHVVFQAHGGSDDASNMISVCAWCHLHGIHGGRLSVDGPAPDASWTVGADPIMEIRGRRKVDVAASRRSARGATLVSI